MGTALTLAFGWQPEIRGIVVVLIAVGVLMGSVYLILITNLGSRLGLLVSLAALFGWMTILGSMWWVYGIGLKGEDPTWEPVEVIVGDVATANSEVAHDLSDWELLPTDDPGRGQAVASADEILVQEVGNVRQSDRLRRGQRLRDRRRHLSRRLLQVLPRPALRHRPGAGGRASDQRAGTTTAHSPGRRRPAGRVRADDPRPRVQAATRGARHARISGDLPRASRECSTHGTRSRCGGTASPSRRPDRGTIPPCPHDARPGDDLRRPEPNGIAPARAATSTRGEGGPVRVRHRAEPRATGAFPGALLPRRDALHHVRHRDRVPLSVRGEPPRARLVRLLRDPAVQRDLLPLVRLRDRQGRPRVGSVAARPPRRFRCAD